MSHLDAIVVGSGFGGSVLAARLAEAGERVLLLERGPWWGDRHSGGSRQQFPRGTGVSRFVRNVRWNRGPRNRELVLHADGLFEFHGFENLWTLTASGVGGGSLVYANGQGRPTDDYWDAFPPEVTAREMAPFFDRAASVLQPSVLPAWEARRDDLADALASVGAGTVGPVELAVMFGDDPTRPESRLNSAGVEQQTCRLCGDCIFGCPHGSKNTLDLNYVALALRKGAQLRPMSEVTTISRTSSGYEVTWTDHRTGRQERGSARRLVLAAGTLNTLRLLFRASATGTIHLATESLGRRFTPNGDYASLLYRVAGGTPLPSPVFTAVRRLEDHQNDGLFLGEAAAPVEALPMPGFLKKRLGESRFFFVLGKEAGAASISYDGEALRTDVGRGSDPAYFARVEHLSRSLAKRYRPRRVLTNIPFGGASETIATTHTLGGAAMARRIEDAVVDHTGQVVGNPGLYVVDGSVLAAPPGVPPSQTIAAMAERLASMAIDEEPAMHAAVGH